MNKYEKSAHEIMKRGDRIIAEKKRRTALIKRMSFAISGACAVIIAGFGIWSNSAVRDSLDKLSASDSSDIIEVNSGYTSETLPDTTAPTAAVSTETTPAVTDFTSTTAATVQPTASTTVTYVTTAGVLKTTRLTVTTTNTVTAQPATAASVTTVTTAVSEGPVAPDPNVRPAENIFRDFTDTESGIRYSAWNDKLSPQLVSGFIKKITLCEKLADNEIRSDSELYSIKGVSPEAIIGVKHEGQEDITIYKNMYYFPETLGDFIDSCGLREYASFTSADYYDFSSGYRLLNYHGFDDSLIWETLFADTDIRSVRVQELLPDQIVHKMTLVYEMKGLLSVRIGFGISEKGYITTNLLDVGAAFYIGEEKAAQFMEMITENYPYDVIWNGNDGDLSGTYAVPEDF